MANQFSLNCIGLDYDIKPVICRAQNEYQGLITRKKLRIKIVVVFLKVRLQDNPRLPTLFRYGK